MRRAGQKKRRAARVSLERLMPDTNPDARPNDPVPAELLRHETPPGLKHWGKITLVAAVAIAVVGIGWRWWQAHNTEAWTDDQAVPTVQIIKPETNLKGGVINLPGEVQAFTTAPIYAQVTGYVRKWY